jgi:mannose-1-phosphate guanylyltransferase
MVLAAGLGTRLRPLTDEVPKPLCWLGDRPQIDHALAHLARSGIPRAVVNAYHLPHHFDDAWAARQPLPIARLVESTLLGTAGGIANAASVLGEGDVVVWNGDIVATPDIEALVAHHRASEAVATLLVAPAAKGGTVGLDASGRVARLRSWSNGGEVRAADYVGIAVVGPSLRARLPAVGCLVGDALLPMLAEGAAVETVSIAEHRGIAAFLDTGSLEDYLAANLAWLAARGTSQWVSEGASVDAGIALRHAIVGPGARVAGEGLIEDCVIWPGATATAPLARAVVTPRGVVRVG